MKEAANIQMTGVVNTQMTGVVNAQMTGVVNAQMIKDYIANNGLTKASFCRQCKIGVHTLDRILSGKNFYINALFGIARVLNIRVHQLLNK